MAKYGEGDKRWIVEERKDGTNVHNWHWSERDCLEWSRSFISSILSNLTIVDDEGGLTIRTKTLEKMDGEAYVNVRKGKIIPGYELSFSISWEAESRGDSVDAPFAKVSGSVEVPYLADENADEDPEVRFVVKDGDGPIGRRVKDALMVKGKPLILEKIRGFVQAMAKGGPAKDEVESKKAPPQAAVKNSNVAVKAEAGEAVEKKEKKEKKEKEGFKTIAMTERFYCRARDMYEILMDENRWKGFTQSNARISNEVGGQFSLFDGSITGVNEELQEAKLIVQKWRFGSWPEGIHSTVRLVFDEPEQGVTVIKLTQSNVPEEDKYGNATVVENTERGWRELIFNKIRAIFGFGI